MVPTPRQHTYHLWYSRSSLYLCGGRKDLEIEEGEAESSSPEIILERNTNAVPGYKENDLDIFNPFRSDPTPGKVTGLPAKPGCAEALQEVVGARFSFQYWG